MKSESPNIDNMLKNIKSKNVNNSNKYYRKAVSIYEKELSNKYKSKFKIVMKKDNNIDHNLSLPIAQHFRMKNFKVSGYDKQLVLYETIKGKGKFKKLIDKREGNGSFNSKLNSIVINLINRIEDKIQKYIETENVNDLEFEYNTPFDKEYNDRYTFQVKMNKNGLINVFLKKINWTFITQSNSKFNQDKITKLNQDLILKTISFKLSSNNKPLNPEYLSKSEINRTKTFIKTIFSTFKDYFDNQNEMIPLAYLLLSEEYDYGAQETDIHMKIDYGYTFLNARSMGFSTILRRLLKFWAHDHSIARITTTAIAWGSQKASRRAGFSQMPSMKHNEKWFKERLSKIKENAIFENTPKNKLRRIIYKKTKVVPKKQMQTMLMKTRPGNNLHQFYNGSFNDYNGTHMFSLKKKKSLQKNFANLG